MNFANEEMVMMQMETSTGPQGKAGKGIVSIDKTAGDGSPGTKDTYTITFTDGSTYSYQVTNGKDGNSGEGGIKEEKDPTVPAWAKQPSKPTYTAKEVDADPAGAASSAVGDHNVSDAAHEDIRQLIIGLSNRLNGIADSDDTTLDQLSEIVAYIKSNKSLIDAITTGKVSTSDVVDNLTTNVKTKVLSAAQGVALKGLIDGVVEQLNEQKEANEAQDKLIKQLNQNIDGLLPDVTNADAGKFLRVSSAGAWVAETVANASGVSF